MKKNAKKLFGFLKHDSNFKRVVIDTLDCMEEANRFYPRLGFVKVAWWAYFPNTLFSLLTEVQFCRWRLELVSSVEKMFA